MRQVERQVVVQLSTVVDVRVVQELLDGDTVVVQGRSRHVISYLQDFLFDPSRARSKAKVLSGGERNRLLLARLFTKPANVLVLDEPTNDLDAETLDVLEDILVDYAGTLIMVSHDRAFLDNVVTSTLVFEGDGVVTEHAGGYTDWRNELARIAVAKRTAGLTAAKPTAQAKPAAAAPAGAKLNNKERKELETLPGKIEQLEAKVAAMPAMPGWERTERLLQAEPVAAIAEPAAARKPVSRRERMARIVAEQAAITAEATARQTLARKAAERDTAMR